MDQITNVNRIGISHETLRRRALNYLHEAQNTLTNLHSISIQLQGLHHKDLNNETVSSIQASLIRYRQNVEEIILHLEIILNKLGQLDGFSQIRMIGLNKLSQRLQKKIQEQQNPADCKMAKYVTFDYTNLCGFGCSMHQLMYCLQLAFENDRVLIVKNHPPGDIFRKWLHQNTLPLSEKCSHLDTNGRSDNIQCPRLRYGHIHNLLPNVLPINMNAELLRLHEAPYVWFAGQLAAYILRPRPQFAQLINATLKSFKMSGDPVVGVHIRRTDKVGVCLYTSLEYGMMHFIVNCSESWQCMFRINNSIQIKRSIYLATDDPNVFTQFPNSHPNYILYGSPGRSHSADLKIRKTYNSWNNAIIDVIALSMTDFLVCTFSSNICRLAYELMQTRQMELGDATQLCHSIDIAFHEEDYSRLKFDVIIPDMKEQLKYGDVVDIFINHGNGSASVKLDQSSRNIHNKSQKDTRNEFFMAPAYKFRPRINIT
ncbi:unnamed protein product [Schistosoma mansoni]|uniref:Smp_030650 n=1 Tax=Schistosoma mansoni TaxID=6183 RepID=UPI0001A641AA|nr:unnamed protein product [Schistosoma mansoni]|eukprot:XP_018645488.1 unnamed protein product [Schistosoma mansoni]